MAPLRSSKLVHCRGPQSYTMNSLITVSVNCGGINGKLDTVHALAGCLDPDVLCLQELWDAVDPSDLELPQRRLFCGGPRPRGGGLAMLVHSRLLAAPRTPPEELNSSHAQVVRVSLPPGWHLTFVNVYLSPGLSSADWDVTRKLVAQVMPQAGPHLLLLCGDLNAVLASERGRVARALTSGHSWDQLYCPYPLGEPTNVVTRQGSVSRREIEYVLIHRASPASSVRQLVHPGVSTHDALYCAVGLTPDFHLPRPFQAAPSIVTS